MIMIMMTILRVGCSALLKTVTTVNFLDLSGVTTRNKRSEDEIEAIIEMRCTGVTKEPAIYP